MTTPAVAVPEADMTPTSGRSRAPAYRPDIDTCGRPVIAAILFSSRIPGFGGVGVDVFSDSGYLITQLLEVSREESTRRTLEHSPATNEAHPASPAGHLPRDGDRRSHVISPDEPINVGKHPSPRPRYSLEQRRTLDRGLGTEPDIR